MRTHTHTYIYIYIYVYTHMQESEDPTSHLADCQVTNGNHEGAFTAVLTPIVDHPHAKDRTWDALEVGALVYGWDWGELGWKTDLMAALDVWTSWMARAGWAADFQKNFISATRAFPNIQKIDDSVAHPERKGAGMRLSRWGVLNIKNIGRRWQCGNVSLESPVL